MNIFKKARVDIGLSQQHVALELDTFQSWISDVEKEKINPSLFWAYEMAEFYGIDFRRVGEYYSRRKGNDKREDKGEDRVSPQKETRGETLQRKSRTPKRNK